MQRPVPNMLEPAYVSVTEADDDKVCYAASRLSGDERQVGGDRQAAPPHLYVPFGAEFSPVSTSIAVL